MNKRAVKSYALAVALACSVSAPALAQDKKPNVVMIMTDDVGHFALASIELPFIVKLTVPARARCPAWLRAVS